MYVGMQASVKQSQGGSYQADRDSQQGCQQEQQDLSPAVMGGAQPGAGSYVPLVLDGSKADA